MTPRPTSASASASASTSAGLAFVLVAGCTEGTPPIVGAWRLAEWSATVGDPAAPLLQETWEDAGFMEFEGDGTLFESVALIEAPRVVERPALEIVPRHTATLWSWQYPGWGTGRDRHELLIAWAAGYGASNGIFVVEERDRDRVEAVANFELGSSSVGLTPVEERWVLEREAP